MMNRSDIVDVLTAVAAGTGREIGEVDVKLWQAVIGDVPKQFALDAVLTHFRELPGVWLEPGHVASRWRDYRRDQSMREDAQALAARQAALDARLEGIDELAESKAIPPARYTRPSGPNALAVDCPWCKATTGHACTIPGSADVTQPHPSRISLVQPEGETA